MYGGLIVSFGCSPALASHGRPRTRPTWLQYPFELTAPGKALKVKGMNDILTMEDSSRSIVRQQLRHLGNQVVLEDVSLCAVSLQTNRTWSSSVVSRLGKPLSITGGFLSSMNPEYRPAVAPRGQANCPGRRPR
jgi:hypothetical protein